jgi:hypothetical protein
MIAPTVITVDKIWIYSFGDNKNTYVEDSDQILQINKLNTQKLEAWEQVLVKVPVTIGCQLGVIILNQSWDSIYTG